MARPCAPLRKEASVRRKLWRIWGRGPGPCSGACGPCIALAAAGASLDLAVNGVEQAAEAASKSVQGGQNGDGNAGGDQGVLDGCGTRLVSEEVRKHGPHVDSPVLALLVMLGPLA